MNEIVWRWSVEKLATLRMVAWNEASENMILESTDRFHRARKSSWSWCQCNKNLTRMQGFVILTELFYFPKNFHERILKIFSLVFMSLSTNHKNFAREKNFLNRNKEKTFPLASRNENSLENSSRSQRFNFHWKCGRIYIHQHL